MRQTVADKLPRDTGARFAMAAHQITPAQASELLAIKLASMQESRCPTLASYATDDVHAPLVAAGILLSRRWPGWGNEWGMLILTEFGERVLLCVAETAMLETGAVVAMTETGS